MTEKLYSKQDIFKIDSTSGELRSFKHPQVEVRPSIIIAGENALIAQEFITSDEVIFTYSAKASDLRTRTSIQIAEDKHIEAGNFASYTNHSCNPNAVLRTAYESETNTAKVALVSVRNIDKGEEISFDYATTETALTDNLKKSPCLCNSKDCRKVMKSFFDLAPTEQKYLFDKGLLSDHIAVIFNKHV